MARLVGSVWLPLVLVLPLCAMSLTVLRDTVIGTYFLAFALLLATDAEGWQSTAWCSTFFYEGDEPEVTWAQIWREAYDPRSFCLRLVAYSGLAALFPLASNAESVNLWIGICLLVIVYVFGLFLVFRRHVVDYMRRRGVPLRRRPTVEEARFDTRNPEDRN